MKGMPLRPITSRTPLAEVFQKLAHVEGLGQKGVVARLVFGDLLHIAADAQQAVGALIDPLHQLLAGVVAALLQPAGQGGQGGEDGGQLGAVGLGEGGRHPLRPLQFQGGGGGCRRGEEGEDRL